MLGAPGGAALLLDVGSGGRRAPAGRAGIAARLRHRLGRRQIVGYRHERCHWRWSTGRDLKKRTCKYMFCYIYKDIRQTMKKKPRISPDDDWTAVAAVVPPERTPGWTAAEVAVDSSWDAVASRHRRWSPHWPGPRGSTGPRTYLKTHEQIAAYRYTGDSQL